MKKMNVEEFFQAIEEISKQNLIDKAEVIETIRNVIIGYFHNKYDPDAILDLIIDPDKNQFKLTNKSVLVVKDDEYEIDMEGIEVSIYFLADVFSSSYIGGSGNSAWQSENPSDDGL